MDKFAVQIEWLAARDEKPAAAAQWNHAIQEIRHGCGMPLAIIDDNDAAFDIQRSDRTGLQVVDPGKGRDAERMSKDRQKTLFALRARDVDERNATWKKIDHAGRNVDCQARLTDSADAQE